MTDEDLDPYTEVIEPLRPIIPRPTQRELEKIELTHGLDIVKPNTHYDCRSKYDFDFLNLRTYADNWDILDEQTQSTLRALVESNFPGNSSQYGMKRQAEFARHLMFLTGCEIWNIQQYAGTNMVVSNLVDEHRHTLTNFTKSRIIDARTCRQANVEFRNHYAVDSLFEYCDAQIIAFEVETEHRYVPETSSEIRKEYKAFFNKNVAILTSWVRNSSLASFIYSHEISCESIIGMRFLPHTHALVFFPKGQQPDWDLFVDRTTVTNTKMVRYLNILPTVHTRFKTVERFVRYLHAVYSPVTVYEREFNADRVTEVNKNAVQVLRAIIELSGGAGDERPYRRIGTSHVPTKVELTEGWTHPVIERIRIQAAKKRERVRVKAAKAAAKANAKAAKAATKGSKTSPP